MALTGACWLLQDASPTAAIVLRGTIRIQDNSTAIAYSGSWIQGDAGHPWSGGTAALGYGLCQRVTLNFSGTGVSWIGAKGPGVGIADVYLDQSPACGGAPPTATIDGYSPTEIVGAQLFTVTDLPWGAHKLVIDVTRTKNAAATDYLVIVDAFDVTGARPDVAAPTVAVSRPAASSVVAGILPITATASDNLGVVGVKFLVDKVQIGAEDTIAPYSVSWNTAAFADGSHTITAIARDDAGNATKATITVTVSNANPPPTARATRFENTDLSITYTDGCPSCGQSPPWYQGSRSRDWSDGTSAFNRSDGARATFAFNGTAVSWIGFRAGWAGIANVYVDDVFNGEIDLYATTTEEVQANVFSVSGLTMGPHTIAVESTGRKNPNATDYAVVVDAFDVSPATPPPLSGSRTEESAPATVFTGGWSKNDASRPWSGGTAAFAATPGERATFTFTGTTITWVGLRGPLTGIARIYLDGAFQTTIDTYAPTEVLGAIYSTTSLAPAKHTLAVEVAPTSPAGRPIYIDAFDTLARIEDDDSAVSYTGTWARGDTGKNWSGTSVNTAAGTAAKSSIPGSYAELAFNGTQVTWLGYKGPSAGIANVSLDGTFVTQVDLYAPAEQLRVPIYTSATLAAGPHVLRVEATGNQNASATNAIVAVDGFDIAIPQPAPAVTRLQEDDASVSYTGAWTTPGPATLFSGETVRVSTTVGDRATFSFTGASVRWIAERGQTSGVARVSIDGILVATVDMIELIQHQYQAPVFKATGLAAGPHTLTIDVVGRNNEPPGATVGSVIVDAFDVY